ncbi:enoyl-CoA hydratase [Achromobacter agilis]|uniref:Short-chain-enoyl-CoA hydratase n=1 Tax=Achromobacter agilis TaxID=1353888 RepID=A0A446C5G0_9BURK|nr:enoyl-CoA hydratase [Achromobacter agilis]SSW63043.1 Short-chain-enoyl-CoA hydratase [Achromobacter agilis]
MTQTPIPAPGRLDVALDGSVARIRIVNPARYNAMSLAMWEGLARAVWEAGAREGVRAIVLEGDGDRAFVSGADISEFGSQRKDPAQIARYDAAVAGAMQALGACPLPVIAAVRGICMGGGMALALACDLRYCTRGSRFRMPAGRLGLGYSMEGLKRMRDILGTARTADLFMTARTVDGAEAARIGLVQEVCADEEFTALVAQRVGEVAGNAPLTLRAAKMALRHLAADPSAPAAQEVDDAVRACFFSRDYQEGQLAFREKRPPVFTGN